MKTSLLYLILVFSLQSCIENYDISISTKTQKLIVEGLLTDNSYENDTIKIYYSQNEGSQVFQNIEISGVTASIVIKEKQQEILLRNVGKGKFSLPENTFLPVGQSYQLKFTLPDGNNYESSFMQKQKTPPILKVYDKFNSKSRQSTDGKKFLSANEVFIDFDDPSQEKNFYLWRYIHYERTYNCKTCTDGLANFNTPKILAVPEGTCDEQPFKSIGLLVSGTQSYGCETICFRTFRNDNAVIFSDLLSNGKKITGTLLTKIPYYNNREGCLIGIQQLVVSQSTYEYIKLLKNLTSGGTLVDTPPTAIVGNIRNITNPKEKVIGFFEVGDGQTLSYWVNRKGATGEIENLADPNFEPRGLYRMEVPLYRCGPNKDRIPYKPEGWQDE